MDVITAEIIRQFFLALSEEMSDVVCRSSWSPVFNEGHDYATAIHYYDGKNVNLVAGVGVSGHTYMTITSIQNIVNQFGDDLHEGDIGLVNDPYYGGSHIPDWALMVPVFRDNRPVFFTVLRAHFLDVGGPVACCKNAYAREIWQEGFRLHPIKLFEKGELREDIWNYLLANTRMPGDVANDLNAMIGACNMAKDRINALIDKYGLETVEESVQYILDYSEKRVRDEIASWPDGEYQGMAVVDSDWGGGARDIKIKCKITVKGDEVIVDFTGTDPQAPGPINATEAITLSWVCTGFSAVCPDVPINQGLFRPIREIILPEGTVVNPNPPAPTGQGTVCCGNSVCEAVTDALSKIVPEKIGTAGLNLCFLYTWGIDARYDTFFLGLDYIASSMGSGGAHGVDGWGGYPSTLSRLAIPTFEMSEIQFPFLYLEGEYAIDTAAPGKWRGVPAFHMRRQTRDVKGNAVVNIFVQGYTHSLTGYVGGKPGAGNYYVLDYGTDKEWLITEFADRPLSPPGQVIFAQSGGGGGWGDPLGRDPQMVLSDVINEYVSLDGAKRDYGVVIDPVTMTVDEPATRELHQGR